MAAAPRARGAAAPHPVEKRLGSLYIHYVHLLEILAALGAVQGILLLLLIGLRFRYHKNLPLAILVVALAARLGTIPSWNPETLLANPWLLPATTPLPFLFGFLIWWYVRELGSVEDATPPLVWIHSLPYLLETLAVAFTVFTMSAGEYQRFIVDLFAGKPPAWMLIRNGLKVAANVVYMALALYHAFGRSPGVSAPRRLWIRSVATVPLLSLGAFAFVALYPAATASMADGVTLPFTVVAVAMLLIIYMLSLLALLFPNILAPGCPDPDPAAPPDGRNERSPHRSTHRSGSTGDCADIAQAARARLEAGAFQDSRLTVRSMARDLNVHPNRLSHAVNLTFGTSFPRMVNGMRVEYFLEQSRTGALQEENILELAFDAGFPSKSTFNRVFKETTGQAPSDYLSTLGKIDRDGGSLAGGAVHGDRAPVKKDDPARNGESKS